MHHVKHILVCFAENTMHLNKMVIVNKNQVSRGVNILKIPKPCLGRIIFPFIDNLNEITERWIVKLLYFVASFLRNILVIKAINADR